MRNDKNTISSNLKKHGLLYGITATILIISLVGLAIVILPNVLRIQRDILFVISAIYLLASCSFFLWIYLRNQDQELVDVLPKAIDELRKFAREYYRNTAAIEDNSISVEKLHNRIEQEIIRIEESNNYFLESNKKIENLLIELRQERGNLQRELDNWDESTIELFQLLERSLETETNSDVNNYINKISEEFEKIINKRGFYRIIPSPNSKFDSREHELKDGEASSDVEESSILKCDRWGYRSGREVLRHAKVILAERPANNNDLEQAKPLEASTTS